jgi:putative sterol carrier protein
MASPVRRRHDRHLVPSCVDMDFGFDPQRALDQLKKLAADAPAQIADGLGRLVRETPPERLDQIMKSPARRPLLDGIFWGIPRQLDAKAAANIKTAIRWNITGRADEGVDSYLLEIDNGTARANRGTEGPDPKLTVTMDGVEFLRLISGNSDPMAAYFKGRIQLAGDIMVAAQLAQIFKMPAGSSGSGSGEDSNGSNGGGELDDPSTH